MFAEPYYVVDTLVPTSDLALYGFEPWAADPGALWQEAVEHVFPDWQQDKYLTDLMNHLRNPTDLQPDRLYGNYAGFRVFQNSATEKGINWSFLEGGVDTLPNLQPEQVAKDNTFVIL